MLRKKAILLIHGFAGGAYDYGNLPNDLEFVNNYKVFTYTLPGHDKAIINKVTKDDWIKMSEMQIEKIIKHGYKEIYVIGHSMGGVIAAYLASKYKDYISLVFYSELFLGGAHPNHYIDTIIYNTKNNSFTNINDLIKIDKNILNKLSDISRGELAKNKVLSSSDVKDMLMDGTSPKTDNFKRFALTDEGIIIFFERYQIAPYYFGDYNILIPYSKLNLNI